MPSFMMAIDLGVNLKGFDHIQISLEKYDNIKNKKGLPDRMMEIGKLELVKHFITFWKKISTVCWRV